MDVFINGEYRAVLRSEKAIEGGPSKVFSVEWYKGNHLLQGSSGYEDYKFARHEAQTLLNNYASQEFAGGA